MAILSAGARQLSPWSGVPSQPPTLWVQRYLHLKRRIDSWFILRYYHTRPMCSPADKCFCLVEINPIDQFCPLARFRQHGSFVVDSNTPRVLRLIYMCWYRTSIVKHLTVMKVWRLGERAWSYFTTTNKTDQIQPDVSYNSICIAACDIRMSGGQGKLSRLIRIGSKECSSLVLCILSDWTWTEADFHLYLPGFIVPMIQLLAWHLDSLATIVFGWYLRPVYRPLRSKQKARALLDRSPQWIPISLDDLDLPFSKLDLDVPMVVEAVPCLSGCSFHSIFHFE